MASNIPLSHSHLLIPTETIELDEPDLEKAEREREDRTRATMKVRKEKVVVQRPTQQQWITEDILAAKRERRKSEKIYRKTGLKSDREKYRRNCEKVKDLICKAKAKYYQDKVEECEGDQKKLFEIVDSLLGRGKCKSLPPYEDALSLAEALVNFL